MTANRAAVGAGIVFAAAFIWGIGNAITGLTAQVYLHSGSLLPGVDIAFANTLGGIAFAITLLSFRLLLVRDRRRAAVKPAPGASTVHSVIAGALKGSNTCLFVFSTTYVAATQSLVLESTYVFWSLLLGVVLLRVRMRPASAALRATLLFVGVVLVANEPAQSQSPGFSGLGVGFGLLAGLTYAAYLFVWSFVTARLEDFESQLASTTALLAFSAMTILVVSTVASRAVLGTWWIPFTSIRTEHAVLQFANGVFVIGVVYVLITIGMTFLKNAPEAPSFIVALALSFSIPFTLLTELAIGKFIPSVAQAAGVVLFIIGFVLISRSLSADRAEPQRT